MIITEEQIPYVRYFTGDFDLLNETHVHFEGCWYPFWKRTHGGLSYLHCGDKHNVPLWCYTCLPLWQPLRLMENRCWQCKSHGTSLNSSDTSTTSVIVIPNSYWWHQRKLTVCLYIHFGSWCNSPCQQTSDLISDAKSDQFNSWHERMSVSPRWCYITSKIGIVWLDNSGGLLVAFQNCMRYYIWCCVNHVTDLITTLVVTSTLTRNQSKCRTTSRP